MIYTQRIKIASLVFSFFVRRTLFTHTQLQHIAVISENTEILHAARSNTTRRCICQFHWIRESSCLECQDGLSYVFVRDISTCLPACPHRGRHEIVDEFNRKYDFDAHEAEDIRDLCTRPISSRSVYYGIIITCAGYPLWGGWNSRGPGAVFRNIC